MDSFIAAFDVATGMELWRSPRQEVPTWATPAIHTVRGRKQIVVNGWKHIGGYDLTTGKEIWKLAGTGDIPVPVPLVGDGLLFLTSAHGPGSPVYAVRDTAEGDISLKQGETANDHIAWSVPRDGAYMVSPVLYRDHLYVTKTNGAFNVFNARSGERVHQGRLGTGGTAFTAATIAGDGKIYFANEDGDTYVMQAGTFEILATNPSGGIIMATPAISEGVVYVRTHNRVIAVK
jgi:outer membrane protein assembly factor BamB